jgi:hypothetical protein
MTEDRTSQLEHQLQIAQRRIEELETRALQADRETERMKIEVHIREAALEAGVRPGAVPDLVARAVRSGEWKVDSQGKLMRMAEGLPDVDTRGDYVTPKTWVHSLKDEAPYYFTGGQTQRPDDSSAEKPAGHLHTGPNPWLAQNWNMTRQARICGISMQEAARLAAEAGCKIGDTRPNPNVSKKVS